jgi:hypothetical protein
MIVGELHYALLAQASYLALLSIDGWSGQKGCNGCEGHAAGIQVLGLHFSSADAGNTGRKLAVKT